MYVMTSPYWNRRTSLAVGHVDDGAQHNGRRLVAHHLSDAAAALLVLGIAAVDIDRAAVAAAGGSAAGITGLLRAWIALRLFLEDLRGDIRVEIHRFRTHSGRCGMRGCKQRGRRKAGCKLDECVHEPPPKGEPP